MDLATFCLYAHRDADVHVLDAERHLFFEASVLFEDTGLCRRLTESGELTVYYPTAVSRLVQKQDLVPAALLVLTEAEAQDAPAAFAGCLERASEGGVRHPAEVPGIYAKNRGEMAEVFRSALYGDRYAGPAEPD
jgi:hypothetical protein